MKSSFTLPKINTNRTISISTEETYLGFALHTDSIKKITDNGHTSYTFAVKSTRQKALAFQNLTIDESAAGTIAFVTTYTPNKKWINAWKNGIPGKFEGEIDINFLDLKNGAQLQNPKTGSSGKTIHKTGQPTTSNLVLECTFVNFYYYEPFSCASGNHFPGDEGCELEGELRAGYTEYVNPEEVCVWKETGSQTPPGGSGGTTTNVPPDYDPCDRNPPPPVYISSKKMLGNKIAVVPPTECDTTELPVPVDTIMTANFVMNTKAMCALAKLMKNSFYKNTLNNFIGENKPIDLTFKLEPIVVPGYISYGQTAPNPLQWNSQNIDLTINANIIDSLSNVQVAFTLLHEGIHAEIYRKLLTIHGPSNLSGLNFPSMFNLYQQYKISNGFAHEYMANYYVNIMSSAIKEYDNNKFDLNYYKALAWQGLEGTDYFKNNLSAQKKSGIADTTILVLKNRNKTNCDD